MTCCLINGTKMKKRKSSGVYIAYAMGNMIALWQVAT